MATTTTQNCPCTLWAVSPEAYNTWGIHRGHHPFCDGTGQPIYSPQHKAEQMAPKYYPCDDGCGKLHTFPPTTLQLLILDLGDSCVVKVEKGDLDNALVLGDYRLVQRRKSVHVVSMPFPDLRAALDGDKPVPRLERGLPCDKPYTDIYQLIVRESDKMHTIYAHEYEALCQLAGKPLPIWTGSGEWEKIFDGFLQMACDVWRYTR